jgi:hypothetical protein
MAAELMNPTRRALPRDMDLVALRGAHLREGIPGDDSLCAVAVALLDTLGIDGARATVTETTIDLRVGPDAWWADVPDEMREFIGQFDLTKEDGALLKTLMTAAEFGLLQWDLTWHLGQRGDG